ncbi:MAG: hypothetical protein L6Q33_01690 [Bacteriovoracaceae bacterium]|nr:hypothetical protein [Bacteriovoracaceae bacterium]
MKYYTLAILTISLAQNTLAAPEKAALKKLSKAQSQIMSICKSNTMSPMPEASQRVLQNIIAQTYLPPVETSCENLKCDQSLLQGQQINCEKMVKCSEEMKELACTAKSKDRLAYSLQKIDDKTLEEFFKFYANNEDKYAQVLAQKKPNLFQCDVKTIKLDDQFVYTKPVVPTDIASNLNTETESTFKMFDADKFKAQIAELKDQQSLSKFVVGNIFNSTHSRPNKIQGYLLRKSNAFGKDFQLQKFVNNGQLNLDAIRDIADKNYADHFCHRREKVLSKIKEFKNKSLTNVGGMDKEILREFLKYKRHIAETLPKEKHARLSAEKLKEVSQLCHIELASKEAYFNLDRSIRTGRTDADSISSDAFMELAGLDTQNPNSKEQVQAMYEESNYRTESYGSYRAADDSSSYDTISNDAMVGELNVNEDSGALENIASSFDQLSTGYPGQNVTSNSSSIFSFPTQLPKVENKKPEEKENNDDNEIAGIDSFKDRADASSNDKALDEIKKLREELNQEIAKSNSQIQRSPASSNAATQVTDSSAQDALRKRIQDLERKISDNNKEKRAEANNWLDDRPSFDGRSRSKSNNFEDSSTISSNDGSYSRSSAANNNVGGSANNNTLSGQANSSLKLIATKSANSIDAFSSGAANSLTAQQLDLIYQKIGNSLEAPFVLETAPGVFVEVKALLDEAGKPKLGKDGKPLFSMSPVKSKENKEKIASKPKDIREIKEAKSAEAITRQMELNSLLKRTTGSVPQDQK